MVRVLRVEDGRVVGIMGMPNCGQADEVMEIDDAIGIPIKRV